MTGPRILAIDLGTSACKVGIFEDGLITAEASEPIRTTHPGPGRAEQDPDAWWAAVVRLVRSVRVASGGASVDGIGVCAQSDSLVPLDAAGRAVGPCMLWMDGRGVAELERAVHTLGAAAIMRRTGLRPGINFTAPKAAWLAHHRPAIYARTAWLTQPKDALVARMIGRAVTDPSSAARSLLYDIDASTWDRELIEAFGLNRERLPPVEPSAALAGRLSREAAGELGLPTGTPVATGAADRAAEALGVALAGDDTLVSTGTATGVVRAITRRLADDDAVITPSHAIAGERIAMLSQPTSGTILDWFGRLVSDAASLSDLEAEARDSPLGANGVIVLPYFMGARSIRWDPSATGTMHGLTLATTRGDIARAIVEGVAFEINACLDRLTTVSGPSRRLLLAGGAHRSTLWSQVLVDVTGLPGVRYADDDAALVGAMLLAVGAIGASDDLRATARSRLVVAASYLPRPTAHDQYRQLAIRFEALSVATRHSSLAVVPGWTNADARIR